MTRPGDTNEIISRNANAVVQRTRVAQSWLLIATCQNIENNPMQSSRVIDTLTDPAKTF
jgi:hypothetical protein